MRKFTAPPRIATVAFSSPFKGFSATPLILAEADKRNLILSGRMSHAAAGRILDNLSSDVPWKSRYEYIEAMAALASLRAQEMARKNSRPERNRLSTFVQCLLPGSLRWFANNMQARCKHPARFHALLPSGTISNEALLSEVEAFLWQESSTLPSTP